MSLLDSADHSSAGEESAPEAAPLRPSSSLSPHDRVIPSWTDPTVRRASAVLGGPLGRHASVGRNRIVTPLRVAIGMAIVVLIVGWLFKSPCIQTGEGGQLDQGGQRPWISGCYNDVVPLYSARGLNHPQRNPYSYVWVQHASDGSTGRVYPMSEVTQSGSSYLVSDAGMTTPLAPADLVETASGTYSHLVDGVLTPVPAADIGGEYELKYLEYPVLTGYFMWGTAALTNGYLAFAERTGIVPQSLDVAVYFTIGAVLLGLLYLWTVASTALIARRRIWDTAIMCLAPLLALHAFTNWDLIAIAFAAAGMLAWARKRSVVAGVLFGLGTAAKLYPLLLLGPLLVLCLRSGRVRSWGATAVTAGLAWLAVNLPVMLAYPQAWKEFFLLNSVRGPEWDSWYFLSTVLTPLNPWSDADGHATALLNVLSLVLFALACLGIGWLALAARRRPRFAQLAFLVVAAFLLTNKVWSPQYSLWLLPLGVLALPRWRRLLVWQLSEVAVWFLLMLSFDTDTSKNLPIEPFVVAALLRDALLIAIIVRVIREIVRPELDLVRLAGDDDPSGGPLDDAPDRWTVPSLRALVGRGRSGKGNDELDDELDQGLDDELGDRPDPDGHVDGLSAGQPGGSVTGRLD